MPDDVPAALPLIAYIAGLLSGRDGIAFCAVGILLLALRRPRPAIIVLAFALGAMSGAPPPPAAIQPDVFTSIEAPIDRDWIARNGSYLLRVRWHGQPLTIVTRFEPRPIQLEQSIVAEGFLRDDLTLLVKSPRLMRYEGEAARWSPATWNRMLANRLRPFAKTFPAEVALVEAVALGRGERLAAEVRDSYKRAGTYHLLVFSGLQIAFAAGALAAMLRWMHAPRVADGSLLAFAIAAPLFIGPTPSVSRASIAIGVYALSRILHRPTTLENLWCVAALARLIVAPADLVDPAFQLTYGGAGALVFVAKGGRRWTYVAAVEWIVTPMTLFHFHQYALGGSLATLALTPLITILLVLSALTCAMPCAALFRAVGAMHAAALRLNDLGAHGAGAFAAPPAVAYAAGCLAALSAIAFARGRCRAVAIALAMAIPIVAACRIATRDVQQPEVAFLDVGQGDAILVRAPGHALLVDGGPSPTRILALLADRGVQNLDAVLLTHAHPDHCGGLPAVISRLRVRELWISPRRFVGDCAAELLDTAGRDEIPIHLVRQNDRLTVGPFRFRAIVPEQTFRRSPENNSSVVLRGVVGKRSILLTGDIERDQEREVAAQAGCVDVLKAAHHGSRTSSTPVLLDATAPRIAVISCGRRNLFGHPHLEVLRAFRSRGVRVWRTDRNGTVEVDFDDDHIFVRSEIDTP